MIKPSWYVTNRADSLFSEIVACVPSEVVAFFDRFEEARGNLTLHQEIDVLNAVAEDEFRRCARQKRPTVLMKWFEVFRDIYILHRVHEQGDEATVRKNPDNFTTFARTFEPLAMLPDFWFAGARNVSRPDVREKVYGIRLSLERYLYERGGGNVWGAMDWEMHRYFQRRIYEPLKTNEAEALRRIAALALTARAVAAGELGLYIEERDDVTLPLSGISNAPCQKIPFLKYYHYDRYTQLSFTREHEFAMDVNAPGDYAAFEPRWMALAVISDVILRESDAHSTHAAATRVVQESVAQCMVRLRRKLSQSSDHVQLRAAVETLYGLVSGDAARLARLSSADLLKRLGVAEAVVPTDYYLSCCAFADAADFWARVLPVFRELVAAFDDQHMRIVAKYTECERRAARRASDVARDFVCAAIDRNNVSELYGEISRPAVRTALASLLADGAFELNPADLAEALLGEGALPARKMRLWSHRLQCARELPNGLPFQTPERMRLAAWAKDVLSRMSVRGNGTKGVSYRTVDFKAVWQSAAQIWNFYYTQDTLCRERWAVSIDRVLTIMDTLKANQFNREVFKSSFRWNYSELSRQILRARLEREKASLQDAGQWPSDMAAARAHLAQSPSCTISDFRSGETRILIMLAVFARLIVHTMRAHPGLWMNRDELFSFFTHILIASKRDYDLPFPWHLDVFTDSYLRVGRTHNRQSNVIDAIVEGRLADEAERQILLAFVAQALKDVARPQEVVTAMETIPVLKTAFGTARLKFLSSAFE